MTGGKARVFAAAELGKAFPELNFVTTSRIETDAPSHAAVMQQELINKGIDPEHILLEEKSISTATELVEMVKMTVANNWSNITIITSDYHIPRTQAIFKNLEAIINYDDPEFRQAISEFHARNCEVSFVSAEEVLSNANPHYANLISKAHESEGYIKRAAAEKQGLKDLSEGRYRIHNLPTQK